VSVLVALLCAGCHRSSELFQSVVGMWVDEEEERQLLITEQSAESYFEGEVEKQMEVREVTADHTVNLLTIEFEMGNKILYDTTRVNTIRLFRPMEEDPEVYRRAGVEPTVVEEEGKVDLPPPTAP